MKKILLLNPPSAIHCARVMHRANMEKPGYRWPPVDFVCLSGYFRESDFYVVYKDFQIHNYLSIWDYLKNNSFDAIISAYSPFFESDDLDLLKNVYLNYPGSEILLLANHNDRLEQGHAERILRGNHFISSIIYDYAYNNLTDFLNERFDDDIFNVLFLENGKLKGQIRHIPKHFELPVPMHKLFISDAYFHYDSGAGYLTSTMSSFGCKMNCPFCWGPNLYPHVSTRTPENLMQEMEYIASCGIKEVFFNDFTFAFHKKGALQFCRLLSASGIKLRWFCSSRFDRMDSELIAAMAQAGCTCIEFGLESGNYDIRKRYGKDCSDATVKKIMQTCRSHGIHTSIFVILGLPEESFKLMKQSMASVRQLKADYLALNILWAEPNTDFSGTVQTEIKEISRTSYAQQINFQHPHVSQQEIIKFYHQEFLRFYLSPLFIARRLSEIRSMARIKNMFKIVKALIRRIVKG
ncbi:radical SAM protein [Desulfococcaceae bacterium HSG7]|nr:radical SAM protein [Desulfococcaceae bacterium HSG7]